MIIDKINEANKPVKDNKPLLKIKSDGSVAEDMFPKTSTFTIKIIEAIGIVAFGCVAWWLATCPRKPKVPGSSPAASYVQR